MSTATPGQPYVAMRRDAPEARRALAALTRSAPLDPTLAELVKIRASQANGCVYCGNVHTKMARDQGETEERLAALPTWRDSDLFDERERAALALTECVTLISAESVPAPVMVEAARHFPGGELTELVVAIATMGVWNRMAIASTITAPGEPAG